MLNLKPDENGPDPLKASRAEHWLALRGLGELADGQYLKIDVGESIVVGRSRHCDWSLRRAPEYLKSDAEARGAIKDDLAFNSVSRRHAKLTYLAPDMLEIENLSGNGTLVDDVAVDKLVLTDVRTKVHRIQLGPKGVVLELSPGSLPV